MYTSPEGEAAGIDDILRQQRILSRKVRKIPESSSNPTPSVSLVIYHSIHYHVIVLHKR